MIHFEVFGKAQPAGSKKANAFGGVYDANPKAAGWKQAVAYVARQEYRAPLIDGPLAVLMAFHRVRPKSHYRTGRNAHLLKDDAPVLPTAKPDVLKTARGIEDSLTKVIWTDDSRICAEFLFKLWGPQECVNIWIADYNDPDIWDVLENMRAAVGCAPRKLSA